MKIVIDHVAGSRRGQRQELDPGGRIRFGRHPESEVSFDAHRDLDASSRHAELRRDGEAWTLRDVGSSNGVFVGGERITEVGVAVGEPIEVSFGLHGPRIQLFIGEAESAPEPPSLSQTFVRRTQRARRPRLVWLGVGAALVVAAIAAAIGLGTCAGSDFGRQWDPREGGSSSRGTT